MSQGKKNKCAGSSYVIGILGEVDTPLEAIVKVTLASSSSQDHGLDDILRAGELLGNGLCLSLV